MYVGIIAATVVIVVVVLFIIIIIIVVVDYLFIMEILHEVHRNTIKVSSVHKIHHSSYTLAQTSLANNRLWEIHSLLSI